MDILNNILFAAALAIIVLALSLVIRKVIYSLLFRLSPTYSSAIAGIAQLTILFGGIGLIIYTTGVEAAIFLTIITIVGAGASLSLDSSIGDLVSTVKLLLYNYYRVGDYISVGKIQGIVEEITAFNTIIRTLKRDKVILNNSEVLAATLTVHNGFPELKLDVHVPVRSNHCRQQVLTLLLDIMKNYEQRLSAADANGEELWTYQIFHKITTCDIYTMSMYVEGVYSQPHYTLLSIAAAEKLNALGIDIGEPLLPNYD